MTTAERDLRRVTFVPASTPPSIAAPEARLCVKAPYLCQMALSHSTGWINSVLFIHVMPGGNHRRNIRR